MVASKGSERFEGFETSMEEQKEQITQPKESKSGVGRIVRGVVIGLLLFLIGMPLVLYIPPVQDVVCQTVVSYLNQTSDDLEFKVGKVRIGFPLKLKVKDVDVLKRSDGTTMIHVGELTTGLDDIPVNQPFFVLNKVHVEDVVVGMDSLTESFGVTGSLKSLDAERLELDLANYQIRLQEGVVESPDFRLMVGPSQPDDPDEEVTITVATCNVLKPSTWETYDKTVHGKLIPYFAPKDIYLKELTPRIFTEYFKHLKTEGRADGGELGAKSVKNIRGVLSAALEDARINKLIDSNPVTDSRLPTFEKDIKKKVPTYTPQQVRQLLDYAKQVESHIYIFLVLVLFTGARKGELLALTWDDVDFEHYMLNINKSRTGTRSSVTKLVTKPKTEGSTREIPLAKEVVAALIEEKAKQEEYERMMGNCAPKNSYIVRTINGTPYSNLSAINRVVNRLTDNAGLPHCTIHGFRHTVASILDDNGVSLQEISVLLGHENVSTTEKIYIHRNRKAKAEDIDLLEHVINQAGETADAS